jgi:hypothetical protein
MLKKLAGSVLSFVAAAVPGTTLAGGRLETLDITGHVPSLIDGHVWANVIGMKWDVRCIPVQYRLNAGSGVMVGGALMVPNPLGPPVLSMADGMTTLQGALDAWNGIPTSFIDLRITGTIDNPGTVGFDFVNEVTFRTPNDYAFLANSPSITLIEDTTLVHGDDIDGDGDSDVSKEIKVARDADGDGDIELPAGFYKAGTILDNDVQFNTKASNGFRFTVGDEAVDTVFRSVDLFHVALHEFGHSHGLSHSLINQKSATDGSGATMFPASDIRDPADELSFRSLDSDDIAYSSLIYPEGTASGPAALQRADVAFDKVYGRITGRMRHGDLREPIAGGHVFAVDAASDTIIAGAYSGTTRYSLDPVTGTLWALTDDTRYNILDGRYELPVPAGTYAIGFEPVDGQPVPFHILNATSEFGTIFGQLAFNEELVWRDSEAEADEHDHRVSGARTFRVKAGKERHVDIRTSRTMNIDDFGTVDFVGYSVPPGFYYAVAIPATEVTALSQGKPFLIKAAAFHTYPLNRSVVPVFSEAILTTGTFTVDPGPPAVGTASVDLAEPLARITGFMAQDNDLSPLFFPDPAALGATVRARIATGEIQNLFLVLRVPTTTPFPGISQAPPFIGLDGVPGGVNDVPINNRSFFSSDDGATFVLDPSFNYRFSLRLGQRRGTDGHHDHE